MTTTMQQSAAATVFGFDIPVEVFSEANRRDHWAAKARRVKRQRLAVLQAWLRSHGHLRKWDASEYRVTLIRVMGKRQRRFDDDNLAGAFKAIRDEIAARLGIDDGDARLDWRYGQERGDGKRGEVRAAIERILRGANNDGE